MGRGRFPSRSTESPGRPPNYSWSRPLTALAAKGRSIPCGEKANQARRPPACQGQYARGERVESPGVSDAAFSNRPAGDGDDVVRRHAAWFIDDENAIHQIAATFTRALTTKRL